MGKLSIAWCSSSYIYHKCPKCSLNPSCSCIFNLNLIRNLKIFIGMTIGSTTWLFMGMILPLGEYLCSTTMSADWGKVVVIKTKTYCKKQLSKLLVHPTVYLCLLGPVILHSFYANDWPKPEPRTHWSERRRLEQSPACTKSLISSAIAIHI